MTEPEAPPAQNTPESRPQSVTLPVDATVLHNADQSFATVPNGGTGKKILGIVIAVAIAGSAWIGTWSLLKTINSPSSPAAVARIVEQARAEIELPQRIDEFTVMTDITSEGSSIHYLYTVEGADPTMLSQEALEAALLPSICAEPETRTILDENIGVKASYFITETGDEYHLEFTKADCE